MKTEHLIASLAADDRRLPSASGAVALQMLAGTTAALVVMWLLFGAPLFITGGLAARALKVGYPAVVAVIAAAAAIQAGRPGANPLLRTMLLFVPGLAVAAVAVLVLSSTPLEDWHEYLLGSTFAKCMLSVALASVPVFAGLTWAFRLLAPTQPRLAGFLLGLASGGAAAAAYGLFCPELSPAFLLGAYTPAMLLPALVGAVAGPRLLRW